MKKNKLLEVLAREFKDTPIVTLNDLTQKIAIVSKVRIGNVSNRNYKDYDEISLYNIDDYGVVFVPDDVKEQDYANETSVKNQALQYGDLVLNQRTSKMKIGFISTKESYKRDIVANNSMIRIQFNPNSIDTARYIQLYLQLPYVLEYLGALPNSSNSNRKILSSAQLLELPIPQYIEEKQLVSLSSLLYPKMELIKQAKVMRDIADELITRYEADKLELIKANFKNKFNSGDLDDDTKSIEVLEALRQVYL